MPIVETTHVYMYNVCMYHMINMHSRLNNSVTVSNGNFIRGLKQAMLLIFHCRVVVTDWDKLSFTVLFLVQAVWFIYSLNINDLKFSFLYPEYSFKWYSYIQMILYLHCINRNV